LAFKGQISEEELAELIRPKLRLFMSVDVVGSTAFKHQSERADSQGWLDFFTSFYTEFPDFLIDAREELLATGNLPRGYLPPAPLWKALGDELIFVAELEHRNQAELHLCAFRAAVCRAVTHYVHGATPLPINFKATAWLAGFPVGNAAIPTDEENCDLSFDFVGPAIDIGFRLAAAAATPRRFVVSVELVYLILVAQSTGFRFFYDGKRALPGVLNDRGYPIIWIDNYGGIIDKGEGGDDFHHEHELTEKEDRLLGREPAASGALKDFCRAYIEEIGHPLMLPFIHRNLDATLPLPVGYDGQLQNLDQRLRDVLEVIGTEEPDPPETTQPLDQLEAWEAGEEPG
jgi:hypothetical protein